MDLEIAVRKALITDLRNVCDIYKKAIKVMDSNHIPQWDELYPNEELLEYDILISQMYIGELGSQVASVFVLNQEYDPLYENGDWAYQESSFMVVHRLCVNPEFQNRHVGTATMLMLENMLKSQGIETVRLDAFSRNPYALRMYEKLGYKKVGEAAWRKGLFYLYEKHL